MTTNVKSLITLGILTKDENGVLHCVSDHIIIVDMIGIDQLYQDGKSYFYYHDEREYVLTAQTKLTVWKKVM